MIFDASNNPRLIILEESDGLSIDASIIYSRTKDWLYSNEGAGYSSPWRVIGGDTLPSGDFAPAFYFLQPEWRIKPPEINGQISIQGNIYREEGSTDQIIHPTTGNYTVLVTLERSSRTERVAVGSGVTPSDINSIAQAVSEINPVNQIDDILEAVIRLRAVIAPINSDGQTVHIINGDSATKTNNVRNISVSATSYQNGNTETIILENN
jgi:hypothetical protein